MAPKPTQTQQWEKKKRATVDSGKGNSKGSSGRGANKVKATEEDEGDLQELQGVWTGTIGKAYEPPKSKNAEKNT